jgi:hypothetical protein
MLILFNNIVNIGGKVGWLRGGFFAWLPGITQSNTSRTTALGEGASPAALQDFHKHNGIATCRKNPQMSHELPF